MMLVPGGRYSVLVSGAYCVDFNQNQGIQTPLNYIK